MSTGDEVIDLDSGPRIPTMYRLAVEYLSGSQGVPRSRIYQDALDSLLADFDWTSKELRDYYGRRAVDIDAHMHAMKDRGVRARKQPPPAQIRKAA